MATSLDTEVNKQIINRVSSDKLLEELEESGQLSANEIYFTPSNENFFSGLPVGAIFPSAIPIVDARVHILDGSTISQTGIYEEFTNLIKTLDASGQSVTCTQEQFDEDIRLTGSCGKFVIDDVARTIRLPKITTFIQGLSNISNIGSSLEAGLPNITSKSDSYTELTLWTGGSDTQYNGAINGLPTGYGPAGGSHGRFVALDFDASRSSAVYGKSSTVQPPATQYPYYIVLASGYKSSQIVNVDNIMTEVNTKTTLLEAYPVGSIYTSTESTSPAQLFGGIWEQLKDTFLLAHGNTYTSEKSKTQSTAEAGSADAIVVAHRHDQLYVANYYLTAWTAGSGLSALNWTSGSSNSNGQNMIGTNTVGSSGAGRNMPPYLTVYMWKRVG